MEIDNIDILNKLTKLKTSSDLKILTTKANKFNIFNVLKLQNNEIRHSNFLAWLMSPFGTHGLGNYFLKAFLKNIVKEYNTNFTAEEIENFDYSDIEIQREYKNIDILITSSKNKFVCLIENKIWSKEHSKQLEKYANTVEQTFSGYKKLYIFLDPKLENNNEIKRNCIYGKICYLPVKYDLIHNILNEIINNNKININSEVKIFIKQYQIMLERNIMHKPDQQIVELSRQIYRENKEAIDTIMQNLDVTSEIQELMKEFIEKHKILFTNIDKEDDKNITCLPKIQNDKLSEDDIKKLSFGNWESSNNLIVRLHFMGCAYSYYKGIYLEILLSPCSEANASSKNLLIDTIQNETNLTIKTAKYDHWQQTEAQKLISTDEYLSCSTKEEAMHIVEQNFEQIANIYINDLYNALKSYCKN